MVYDKGVEEFQTTCLAGWNTGNNSPGLSGQCLLFSLYDSEAAIVLIVVTVWLLLCPKF